MAIESVIFDLEGVIIDTEPLWDQVSIIFLERRKAIYNRERTKPLLMGKTLAEGVRIMQEQYGFGGNVEEQATERREIARELFSEDVVFIPGFEKFYENIVGKGLKSAIATSLERDFLKSMDQRLKLSELFNDKIFSIADVGYKSKPNPDIFLHAASQLSTLPLNSLVIEDAPNGVEAARRAGMRCVALTTSTTREKLIGANLVVDSYTEIDLSKF